MGIEYKIDTAEKIIYEIYKGNIKAQDVIDHINRQCADPLFTYDMHSLADLTQADGNWSYFDIIQLRNFAKAVFEGKVKTIKWALIPPPPPADAIVKTLALMTEAVGETIKIRIFDNHQDALGWLKQES